MKGRLLMQHISQALLPQITEEYAGGIEFIFPDAPISLNEVLADEQDHHSGVNRRAWWLNLDNTSRYIGLEDTIVTLAQSLGGRPVHAAVGFSQGGAFAAMIASLCEATHNSGKRRVLEAQGLPMNLFLENIPGQRPLKFVICISAYRGTMKYYSSLYSQSLSTRSFHIIGTLDTVVEELESEVLATAFEQPNIFRHFGTHYIPRDPVFFRHLDGFLEDACDSSLDADADTKTPTVKPLFSGIKTGCKVTVLFPKPVCHGEENSNQVCGRERAFKGRYIECYF